MATSAQRIAGLEQQLADLTERFAQLEQDAFFVKTLEQLIVEHAGGGTGHRAAPRRSRPRHLRAAGDPR